jgi:predicted esterase
MPMIRLSVFVFLLLVAIVTVSCASPATSTASPTLNPPMLKPEDSLGEAVVEIAKDETGEPDVFTFCDPLITESDPRVIVRTCTVPQLPYLFIGYAELANTQEELESLWKAKTWQLYFDQQPVDLQSFGFFDMNWQRYRLRRWKIAVENLPPGEHSLHYILTSADPQKTEDITWVFTIGESASTSSPIMEKIVYPTLPSETITGLHPYTSKKSGLNFWLYLPASYGKDTEQKWPLILDLHGGGGQGNDNLDSLLMGGLPQKLQKETDFPFIAVSPLGSGEYEVWSKDEMTDSLFVLLEEIQARYSVDSKRIYLTGVSVGGEGVWEIGLRYPDRFAALVPVMGYYGYPFKVPINICDLKEVPIWAFHGAEDELVPVDAEEGLVNTLKTCGGNAQVTIFPNAGHDIENEVYANPELYKWLLSQKRP